MNLEDIKESKPELEFLMEEIEDPGLRNCVEYMMETGGKRIRPIICMSATREMEGDLESAKVFCGALELLHNYTLVHDDIQDGDKFRRGEATVWQEFGTPQAIETGDAMHSLSYRILISNADHLGDYLDPLIETLNRADLEVASGQSKDIHFRDQNILEEEKYLEMCRLKTGSLFSAALEASSIVSDREKDRETMMELGKVLGMSFQIKDDIIDIKGQKGRPRGGDIREGKASLPLIYALQELEADEKKFLESTLRSEDPDEEKIQRALETVEGTEAVRRAEQRSEKLLEEAKEIIDALDEDLKEVREISDFLVNRNC